MATSQIPSTTAGVLSRFDKDQCHYCWLACFHNTWLHMLCCALWSTVECLRANSLMQTCWLWKPSREYSVCSIICDVRWVADILRDCAVLSAVVLHC